MTERDEGSNSKDLVHVGELPSSGGKPAAGAPPSNGARRVPRRRSSSASALAHQAGAFPIAGGMQEELRAYRDILRRNAGLIRTVFLGVLALALVFTLFQEPVYRASALLEIRSEDGDIPSMEGLFEGRAPSEEYLRTHFGLLRSAALARLVIDDLGLDSLEEFRPEPDTSPQAVVDGFLERLIVDPVEESRLVQVSFDSSSPEQSARVANAIVDQYARLRADARAYAAERLAFQRDSVETRLERSERELRAYAEEHDLPVLIEEDLSTSLGTRIADLRGRLAEAEGARYESESVYDVVVREGRVDVIEDALLQELRSRRTQLREEYARISATFTDEFPAAAELRRQIDHLTDLIREEEGRIARRVESEYRLAMQREQRIAAAIEAEAELANELGPASGEYHVLRQAVLANRTLYATLTERHREAEIAAAVGSTAFRVVDPAVPPIEPHRPVFAMNLGLAAMLGLLLGLVGAIGRELLDDTVRSEDDMPTATSVPVLAMIPALDPDDPARVFGPGSRARDLLPWPSVEAARARQRTMRQHQSWPRIDVVKKGEAGAHTLADAFGTLRAAVLFDEEAPETRSILVSSCRAGEGKTTVSVNLAMSLAKLGNKVLLIDADLRKPAVHRALGLGSGPHGLLAYLVKGGDWRDLLRTTSVRGLEVLRAGGTTRRAGDLMSGDRLGALLRDAESEYDYVIVDAPALFINAPDARLISREVDGVVVVVRSRSTPKALVDRIPVAVPNVIGVVINDLRRTSLPDYFGDYFDGYAEPAARTSEPTARESSPGPTEMVGRVARWINNELLRTS